jgi:hypothetical protein
LTGGPFGCGSASAQGKAQGKSEIRASIEETVLRYLPFQLLDKQVWQQIAAWQTLECDITGAFIGLPYEQWLKDQ